MSDPMFVDRNMKLLEQALTLRQKRQQLIAANVANSNTPGYAPVRIDFENQLLQANKNQASGRLANPRHIGFGQEVGNVEGKIRRLSTRNLSGDKNGVNLDEEMISLARNQLLYETAVQSLNKKLGLLKYVAQGGR